MGNKPSSKSKRDSRRKDTIISIVFLAAVVVGILIAILYGSGVFDDIGYSGGDRKVKIETADDTSAKSDDGNISVPGYEKLQLKADTKKQKVYLTNPKGNNCYFVMSLILEDGTVIWKSDYLEPGMAFDRIELEKPLEAGTYENVTLRYDCYALSDKSELNGSAIKIELEAK
ncbi:hypothetical protein [Agathobacter sp.]